MLAILIVLSVITALTILFAEWVAERYFIDENGTFLEYFDNDYDYKWREHN